MMVPDGIEPVIAWRRWTLDGLTGLSAIGVQDYVWPHRVAEPARCLSSGFSHAASAYVYMSGLHPEHGETPSENCMCGYWALKRMPDDYGDVVGTVKLWGKIIEGEDGYRAQYAYPDHLYLIDMPHWQREPLWHREGRARMLGEAYGVECTLLTPQDYLELRQLDHEGHKPAKPKQGVVATTGGTGHTLATTGATTSGFQLANQWLTMPQIKITGNTMIGEQMGEPMSEPEPHDPNRRWRNILWACICLNVGAIIGNLIVAATS